MKTLLAVFTIGLCIIQANAQKTNAKDVPANVKSGLVKNYAITNAQWDKEGSNYEASFKQKGKEISVVLDGTGSVLEVEHEIKKSELPVAILETLKKDYAGYEIEETAKIDTKGVITYEAEVEKGKESFDLIFNSEGKLLTKELKQRKAKD